MFAQRRLRERIAAFCTKHDVIQPSQSVDLGKFRKTVEAWKRNADNRHQAGEIFPQQEDAIWEEADRLLALIDSKGVGDG